MPDENGLHLGWPQSFARDLDRIIRAAQNIPKPIVIDGRKITVHPDILPARPVGIEVSLFVLPEAARHPDPRRFDHQFTNRIANGFSVLIQYIRGDARAWRRERARL